MDGYVWCVLCIKNEDGMYAYAQRIPMNHNLASFVKDFPDLEYMNSCTTMKKAKETAQAWNDSFKANGTYMFADGPKF